MSTSYTVISSARFLALKYQFDEFNSILHEVCLDR
jgi:hypothetical protein